jgi:hypothetical protein
LQVGEGRDRNTSAQDISTGVSAPTSCTFGKTKWKSVCWVKLRAELLRPEAIDMAIESFGRLLRTALAGVSNELTEMRSRKEKLEREIRNFTEAIAENGHSKYILEGITVRENEISGITDRLLSSAPDSIQTHIEEVRRIVEDGIQNLSHLCSENSPAAKQELHRHLGAVRMLPLEDGEGWYYVAEGTWDLLGTDPHQPTVQVPVEGRIRMVAGACGAPKPPDLPFRYRLPVARRIPKILMPPDGTGGFEPPALGA